MLIGIMGPKGSGKSTIANYLVRHHGFIEKSFADPLKKVCKELFLFNDEQLYGTQEQKETPDAKWFGATPRQVFQFIGTDLLRNNLNQIMPGLGENIFTYHFKLWYEAERLRNPNSNIVISDVRFLNEVELIKHIGGQIIKIHRPELVNDDLHQSEKEQESITIYDFIIVNDDNLDSLYKNVDINLKL